jgi:predicted transcriptional regulator
VVKRTIYLPDELHRRIKQAAEGRGIGEAELIRTALHHELGAPTGQPEHAHRRARLLAAIGKIGHSVYSADYLDKLRDEWRN